ncbi:TOTE conflict system archaeo-eukaryotic primase domain-containing protein [Bradyrhizobium lablabi]|uniref:TOTE conflict system archaeo-eukaryotic primase domain-containing protein n=1 Tax=Bradyrhizobium lablabi TaxID=722472 RepID=UPI0012AB921F
MVLPARAGDPIDRNSTIKEEIALFRRLFRGRSDVFPVRWENRATGRSGYAPSGPHGCETPYWLSGNWLQDIGCARFVFRSGYCIALTPPRKTRSS